MRTFSNHLIRSSGNRVGIILIALLLPHHSLPGAFANAPEITGKRQLSITGSEFYRRSRSDPGQIRIFLTNDGAAPVSIDQCAIRKFPETDAGNAPTAGTEVEHMYARLAPPVLAPGHNGELLIQLLSDVPEGSRLRCSMREDGGRALETWVSVKQAPLWISYVGCSRDLDTVYVYALNTTDTLLHIRLLEVAGVTVGDDYQSVNSDLSPGDKGCLVFKMPRRGTLGEYIHIGVSARSDREEVKTYRVAKAVNEFPLLPVGGSPQPELGLDSRDLFVQTMSCPAHEYGTYEQASGKFVDDYSRRFTQAPHSLIQMWICRADRPRAWYMFGPLPDAAVINPVLSPPRAYESDARAGDRFCPFFWLATVAKDATAPNRYFACISLQPEDIIFSQSSHTPDEIEFLVYCAIAGGAKGILYRGERSPGQLSHDRFVRLNRELRQLKSLLMIAEPVEWASTADDTYVAKSLLCGDEAIITVVFDRRYFSVQRDMKLGTPAFARAVRTARIQVKVPTGLGVSEVRSMYAPLSAGLWRCETGQLDFTARMVDSVGVYRAVLKHITSTSRLEE